MVETPRRFTPAGCVKMPTRFPLRIENLFSSNTSIPKYTFVSVPLRLKQGTISDRRKIDIKKLILSI